MRISAKEVQEHKGDFADFNCKAPFEISRPSPFSPSTSAPPKHYSWKTFAFGKYAFQPIRLSILKLDGSSFDIIVTKKATVAKLKKAVEAAFSYLPRQGDGKVLWSHVWGQFCLCFRDKKLLRDRDSIVNYGIHHGDQLRFVRHTPVYNLAWETSEKLAYILDEFEGDMRKKQQNLVQNEVDKSYVDFGANRKVGSKWACTMRGLFSHRKMEGPPKGNDHVGNSSIRLGRSFAHDDIDVDMKWRRDISCRFDGGPKRFGCGISDPSFPFNGFAGGFSYPTGYCMK